MVSVSHPTWMLSAGVLLESNLNVSCLRYCGIIHGVFQLGFQHGGNPLPGERVDGP